LKKTQNINGKQLSLLNKPFTVDKTEKLLENNTQTSTKHKTSKTAKNYPITEYNDRCEEFSKINEIILLEINFFKVFLYFLLNLITGFFINLFLVWFPKLKLTFIYSPTSISKAKYAGIFGRGKFKFNL
jgi:hypothetical protein